MTSIRVRVTFDTNLVANSELERTAEFTDLRDPGGKEFVAQVLFSELENEARLGSLYVALPSTDDFIRPVTQSFHPADIFTGAYEDRANTRAMWTEIGNILLRVKRLLAQSRGYHDQELAHLASNNSEAENLAAHFHLKKLDDFDLAVIMLGKFSDLTARLVFERLGASVIPNLDRSSLDWERSVTWANIRQGLSRRIENPCIAELTDAEYGAVTEIFDEFFRTENGGRLWRYRIGVVHRITPSVDRVDLYTHLQSRARNPIVDESGRTTGWTMSIGQAPDTATYLFVDVYNDAIETLRHYVSLLRRLDAIPRFGPKAATPAAA